MVIAINHLHLLAHHNVDHLHHYFGYDQKTEKKPVQIKHFDRPQIDRYVFDNSVLQINDLIFQNVNALNYGLF